MSRYPTDSILTQLTDAARSEPPPALDSERLWQRFEGALDADEATSQRRLRRTDQAGHADIKGLGRLLMAAKNWAERRRTARGSMQ